MESLMLDIQQLRTLDKGEPFICLFSGGKDCGLALALACQSGNPVSLIHCMDSDVSSNHHQKIDVIEKQAFAMGIPLSIIWCDMRAKQYIYYLTKELKRFEIDAVKSLVTGTIYDIHAYKIYTTMCSNASMTLRCPLWGYSDKEILSALAANSIKAMITTINDSRISSSWLGKIYDTSAYDAFQKLGIHPFGEYDEFHTTLIDANFFKKKITVKYNNKTINHLELELCV